MTGRLLLVLALSALASACASSGPLGGASLRGGPPTSLPPVSGAPPSFRAERPTANWGVGYLAAINGVASVDIPMFDTPGGRHWGWLTQGRAVEYGARTAPPQRSEARVRPPGEPPAFLVLDTARGGWLRLRWGGPEDPRGGVGWTRLADARGALRYTSWEDHVRRAGGLNYRNSGAAHNLRAGPGTDHAVLRRMEGRNFDLEALEIRGDWMRVRFASPPVCGPGASRIGDDSGLLGGLDDTGGSDGLLGGLPAGSDDLLGDGPDGESEVGWVRWRSEQRGPWVRRTRASCGDGGGVG